MSCDLCLSVSRLLSTPEELVRWSMEPDLRNVPRSGSGRSAPAMTGYAVTLPVHAASSVVLGSSHGLSVCPVLLQGSKCPSGCRIQGLINKYDSMLLKKIEKIRSLLDQNKAKHRSADQVSKQTYDYLKEKLTSDAGQ